MTIKRNSKEWWDKKLGRNMHKINFNKFVDEATRHAHSELLKNGAEGLRSSIFIYISSALEHREQGRI